MARYMGEDTGKLWRAVFVFYRESGEVRTFYGPYGRKQDAAGMLTRMSRWHKTAIEKHVEWTVVRWEPVE